MASKVKGAVLGSLGPHHARLYAELAAAAQRFIECHRLSPPLSPPAPDRSRPVSGDPAEKAIFWQLLFQFPFSG
jgi:hypothetical protein